MKRSILTSCTLLSLALVLGSCSVNKRVYRPGYHIEWNHNSEAKAESPSAPAEGTAAVKEDQPEAAAATDEIISQPETPVTDIAAAPAQPKKKASMLSRIIKEDTPEETAQINAGSKSLAFKSGFKKGLKLMMPDETAPMSHFAIASFVLGIISLFAYYGAFVLGLLAIIFGAVALHKIRTGDGAYRGSTLAWIGLICGIISIALALVIIRVY